MNKIQTQEIEAVALIETKDPKKVLAFLNQNFIKATLIASNSKTVKVKITTEVSTHPHYTPALNKRRIKDKIYSLNDSGICIDNLNLTNYKEEAQIYGNSQGMSM